MALVSALSINIGTLSKPWISSMHKAAAKANVLGKPWVLDPVGAGATNLRTQTCKDLVLHEPTVIRGNASEIMALANSISIGLNALPGRQLEGSFRALEFRYFITPDVSTSLKTSISSLFYEITPSPVGLATCATQSTHKARNTNG